MKILKWAGGLLLALVILAAIAFYVALSNINDIVKTAVNTVGTEVVGSEVKLHAADVKLQDGRAELQDLRIANPRGFSNSSFLSVGAVTVDIDPLSLTRDVIVIDEVRLSEIDLLVEQKALTTNVQALLEQLSGDGAESGDASSESATQNQSDPIKLAVKQFTFEQSTVELSTEKWGDTTIPLPQIKLANLGSAEQGLTPQQLAEAVTQPVLNQVQRQVKDQLKEMAKHEAKQKLEEKLTEKLSDSEKEAFDALKSLF